MRSFEEENEGLRDASILERYQDLAPAGETKPDWSLGETVGAGGVSFGSGPIPSVAEVALSPEELEAYKANDPFAVSDKPGGLKPETIAALHEKRGGGPRNFSFPGSQEGNLQADAEAQAAMDRTTGAPGLAGNVGLPPAQPNAAPPGQLGSNAEREQQRILGGIPGVTPEQEALDRMRQDGAIDQQAAAQQQADFNAAERERVAQIEQANRAAQERALAELRAAQAQALENSRKRLETMEKDAVEDPNRFWDNHFAGPVFGRIGAAIGIGLATFGGQGQLAYKMVSDGINRDIDAQRQTLAAKQKLAERWGQHDARSAALLEDRMEDLERARVAALNDSARRMENMAKGLGDQNKIRAAGETAAKFRADAANHLEQINTAVSKRVLEDRKKREAAAAAAANAGNVLEQVRKAHLKGRLKGIEKKGESDVTGEGPGTGQLTPGKFADLLNKYSTSRNKVDDFEVSIGRMEEQLKGFKDDDLPGFGPVGKYRPMILMGPEGQRLRQTATDLMNSEIYRQSGKAISPGEYERLKQALSGAGGKKDLEWGLSKLREMHSHANKAAERGAVPAVRDFYKNNE